MPSRRALLGAGCGHALGLGCTLIGLAAAGPAVASTSSATDTPPAHAWLPRSRRVGHCTLRMLGFTVYDAALYALADFDGASFAAHPLVLEIVYRRALSGQDIADYSLKEMRRAGAFDDASAQRWLQFMRSAFPDVRSGDRLTGQWSPDSGTSRFAANGGPAVALQDAGFGPRFFGIWLAPQTPRPDMREQLLGLRAPG